MKWYGMEGRGARRREEYILALVGLMSMPNEWTGTFATVKATSTITMFRATYLSAGPWR